MDSSQSASSKQSPVTGETPVVAVAGVIAPAGWPDVVRGFYVTAGAVAIAWRIPTVADYALLAITTVASPALVRSLLDRFRR